MKPVSIQNTKETEDEGLIVKSTFGVLAVHHEHLLLTKRQGKGGIDSCRYKLQG